MNYIDTREAWKANDGWEFADKDAAWNYFFMAGMAAAEEIREPHDSQADHPPISVVPYYMEDSIQGFVVGMLIGNLRRIHAAYDVDGEDLSALPMQAASEIERFVEQLAKATNNEKMAKERAELLEEENERLHIALDKAGVPRADGEDGLVFSILGRVLKLKEMQL